MWEGGSASGCDSIFLHPLSSPLLPTPHPPSLSHHHHRHPPTPTPHGRSVPSFPQPRSPIPLIQPASFHKCGTTRALTLLRLRGVPTSRTRSHVRCNFAWQQLGAHLMWHLRLSLEMRCWMVLSECCSSSSDVTLSSNPRTRGITSQCPQGIPFSILWRRTLE